MFRANCSGHLRGAKLVLHTVPLAAAFLAALVFTMPTSAAIIVRDTWRDGTDDDPASPVYSENGTDTDLDGNRESVWYQGGDGTLDPVGVGGPQRGAFSDHGRLVRLVDDLLYARSVAHYSGERQGQDETHLGLHADRCEC